MFTFLHFDMFTFSFFTSHSAFLQSHFYFYFLKFLPLHFFELFTCVHLFIFMLTFLTFFTLRCITLHYFALMLCVALRCTAFEFAFAFAFALAFCASHITHHTSHISSHILTSCISSLLISFHSISSLFSLTLLPSYSLSHTSSLSYCLTLLLRCSLTTLLTYSFTFFQCYSLSLFVSVSPLSSLTHPWYFNTLTSTGTPTCLPGKSAQIPSRHIEFCSSSFWNGGHFFFWGVGDDRLNCGLYFLLPVFVCPRATLHEHPQ